MNTISLPAWAKKKFDEWFESYPKCKPEMNRFFAKNNQQIYTRAECKAVGSLVSPDMKESITLHYVFPHVNIRHEVL